MQEDQIRLCIGEVTMNIGRIQAAMVKCAESWEADTEEQLKSIPRMTRAKPSFRGAMNALEGAQHREFWAKYLSRVGSKPFYGYKVKGGGLGEPLHNPNNPWDVANPGVPQENYALIANKWLQLPVRSGSREDDAALVQAAAQGGVPSMEGIAGTRLAKHAPPNPYRSAVDATKEMELASNK